jgi:hypothetical protein
MAHNNKHNIALMTSATAKEALINKLWSEYLEDVKAFDTGLTETWKEDANGVLTFVSPMLLVPEYVAVTTCKTAIFSATVATFIVESYKLLSPDSGAQTVFVLGQLSQQFAGFANGTYVQPQTYPASPPSASVVWLNSIWLLSLMLSTTSALLATLTQQWARRYLQLPQMRSVPSDRARVRSYLFLGTVKYAMYHAAETAPTLLHLSVFLFNVGLVLFFFAIYKTVAIVVLVFVALFGVAYFVLTILPCLDHICPYRTPLSSISWYLWHAFASFTEFFIRAILKHLHTLLVPYNPGDVESGTRIQAKLTKWLGYIKNSLDRHRERLRDGFRGSIVKDALRGPLEIDVKALAWLFQLPVLAERGKIEKFVAAIPGEITIRLLNIPFEKGTITFRDHVLGLLRSCVPRTDGLDEGMRSHRLSVCLDAIYDVVWASIFPNGFTLTESILRDVRTDFASLDLMRPLWADGNPTIRVKSRSICALLARRLLRKTAPEQPELAWLQDVLGKSSNTIYNQLNNLAAVDNMNIDSFVYGVLSHHQTEDLSSMQATTFAETLTILMNSESQFPLPLETLEDQLSSLIRRVEQGDHIDRDNVVGKLRRMSGAIISIARQQSQGMNA